MSTERHQVESRLSVEPEEPAGTPDPLVIKLTESRFQCCDELEMVGYDKGCDRCPVRGKCRQLWHPVEDAHRDLSLREYRCLSHRFNAVLVWALDRLTRQGIGYILQLVNTLRTYKVKVISYQESWTEQSNEAMEDLFYAMVGWAAKFESDRRSERIKIAVEKRRNKGLPVGRLKGAKDRKPRKKTGYYLRHAERR